MDPAGRHQPSQKDGSGGGLSQTPAVPSPGRDGHPCGERDQVPVWAPPRGSCNPCLGLLVRVGEVPPIRVANIALPPPPPPRSLLTGPNAFKMALAAKGRYLHAANTCNTVSRHPQMSHFERPKTSCVRALMTNFFHKAFCIKSCKTPGARTWWNNAHTCGCCPSSGCGSGEKWYSE